MSDANPQDRTPVGHYTRVSADRNSNSNSIQDQLEQIRKHAQKNNMDAVDEDADVNSSPEAGETAPEE